MFRTVAITAGALLLALGPLAGQARAQSKDIVDTAVGAGTFTTLARR